jgi:ssDNA-binding Zn-finger/Zn-ribbon topoisomerase 1
MGDMADMLIADGMESLYSGYMDYEEDKYDRVRRTASAGDKCHACDDGTYIKRINSCSGVTFLGCSRYPKCRSTISHRFIITQGGLNES